MQHSYNIDIKITFSLKQHSNQDDNILPVEHGKAINAPKHEQLNIKQTNKGTIWKRFFLSILLMTVTGYGEPQTQIIIYQGNRTDVQISQSTSETNTYRTNE